MLTELLLVRFILQHNIMAQITPNLQLTVWNSLTDPYDSGQLVDNFVKIDLHDHSGSGKGVQIDGATGIKPDSIGTPQMASNSITAAELSSSSTVDSLRAVGNNHIQDGSISGDKIATNTITLDKLNQETLIPLVYHTNANGSLPSTTVEGNKPLFDGYTIDYAFGTSGTFNQHVPTTTGNSTAYIWRLRYNAATSYWDPVGGNPFARYTTTSLTGSSPAEGSMYVYWGGGAFQSFTPPLRGDYKVEAFFSADVEQSKINYAIFRAALYQGALPSPSNAAVSEANIIDGTSSYTYCPGIEAGGSDQVSTVSTAAIIPAAASTTISGNVIRQCFGASNVVNQSGQSGGDIVLYSQRLHVMPHHSLRNYE